MVIQMAHRKSNDHFKRLFTALAVLADSCKRLVRQRPQYRSYLPASELNYCHGICRGLFFILQIL